MSGAERSDALAPWGRHSCLPSAQAGKECLPHSAAFPAHPNKSLNPHAPQVGSILTSGFKVPNLSGCAERAGSAGWTGDTVWRYRSGSPHGADPHPTADPRMAAPLAHRRAGRLHLLPPRTWPVAGRLRNEPVRRLGLRTLGAPPVRPRTNRLLLLLRLGQPDPFEPLPRAAPPAPRL